MGVAPMRTLSLQLTWLTGLARRRTGHLLATAVGITLAVGLLASLGVFL